MAVPISFEPEFQAGTAQSLLAGDYLVTSITGRFQRDFDIAPNGQDFVMIRESQQEAPDIVIVLNWFEELKRLVPTGP